jgi:hypothetical protein
MFSGTSNASAGAYRMIANWAEKNLKLIPAFIGTVTLVIGFSVLLLANAVQEPPPSEADRISDIGTLLVVMQAGCGACTYFEQKVAPAYERTPQAATTLMRYIDISEVRQQQTYHLKSGVFGTPTIVMIDGFGREVGRKVGSPATGDDLARLVERYAARMTRKGV